MLFGVLCPWPLLLDLSLLIPSMTGPESLAALRSFVLSPDWIAVVPTAADMVPQGDLKHGSPAWPYSRGTRSTPAFVSLPNNTGDITE